MDFRIGIKWHKVILIVVVLAILGVSRLYFSKKAEKNIEENKKSAQAEIEKTQKDIAEQIAAMDLTMTELPISDLNQQETNLSSIRGDNAMALYFTTADKLILSGDLPLFIKLYEENKNDMNFGVIVMNANGEDVKEKIDKFVSEEKVTIPIYTSSEEEKSLSKFGMTALPSRMAISKEGKIKSLIVGDGNLSEQDLREMIDQAIK